MGKNNRQRRAVKKRNRSRSGQPTPAGAPEPAPFFGAPDPRAVLEEIQKLVDYASWCVVESPVTAGPFVSDLQDFSRQAQTRFLDPAAIVSEEVLAALTRCWDSGWQPLDIVHVVRRRGSARAAEWATRAVLAEAGRSRAFARAPHAWRGQLSSLVAEPGPAVSADDLIDPRGRADVATWVAALVTLCLLRQLPRAEPLMPLPSAWDRQRPTAAGAARSNPSDPKLLSRIRALLAKAESTEFAAEAEAYTAKAQDLMTRHSVDEALLHRDAGDSITVGGRRVHIDNPYAPEKADLLNQVAHANRVRAIWHEFPSFMTIVGVPTDLEQVEMLFTSLLIQATRAMTDAGRSSRANSVDRSSSFRRAFLVAYATRIGQRLTTAADDAIASYGNALVPVFERQAKAVEEEYERLFPQVKESQGGRRLNRRGWEAGTAAADRAVLPAGQVES
ncbi:MAG: DUF2786 domain-containing protein [Marmoricola sp.]